MLTIEEVERIARLARLNLTDEELHRYREQLSAILDYAQRLQALDVPEPPAPETALPEDSKLRADAARPGLSLEELLANAPQHEAGQFKVPPILE